MFGKLKCKLRRHKQKDAWIWESTIKNTRPIKKFIIHVDGERRFFQVLEGDIRDIPYGVCERCGKKIRKGRGIIIKGRKAEQITEEEFENLKV